ncbi:hypothetical protein [Archangium sp.]|uniref:hypothetical protein n=1 Tax=Archangium sp. TaxID=1872627 RepID=UPI00286C7A66|nr:hypothetical protein [Archangium sp.]
MNSHRSSGPPLLLSLGLLLAPAARAQTEAIAQHPCHVVGERSAKVIEDIQGLCEAALVSANLQLVPSDDVRAFLDTQPKKSCVLGKQFVDHKSVVQNESTTACLARLAAATHVNRAVLLLITPGESTLATGLVVDSTGQTLKQMSVRLRNRGRPQREFLQAVISPLIKQLELVPVKPEPPVEPPPTPPDPVATPTPEQTPATDTARVEPSPAPLPTAPPAAPQVAQSAPPSGSAFNWKSRVVTYAGAGVAGAGLVLAGVFTFLGNDTIQQSNTYYEGGNLPSLGQLPQVYELRQKASTQRTIAAVSAAVGGLALAGTGVQLWLKHRGATPPPGTTALSVGPGGVSVHVLLP